MKPVIYALLFICYVSLAHAKDFVDGFEDIPLMSGLKQLTNNDISFGNEETRYIETELMSSKKKDFINIKSFYLKTLPQLGWMLKLNAENKIAFYRDADFLEIDKLSDFPTKIRLSLKNNE